MEKVCENITFEEWPATANSVLAFCNPQDITSYSQDPYHSSEYYINPWEVFLVNSLFFGSEASQIRNRTREERLSGLEILIIHRETN